MKFKAIAANSKIYFGSEIPRMFLDSGPGSSSSAASKAIEALSEGILDMEWREKLCCSTEDKWTGNKRD